MHNMITPFKIKLIVAMSENGIIGDKGAIPWKLPDEMKHFKKTTQNNIVIMGHKTWLSLLPYNKGGYLTDRINIVLSKDERKVKTLKEQYGVDHPCLDFRTSVDKEELEAMATFSAYSNAFVIGGKQIYDLYLEKDVVDELIITKIKMKLHGDTKLENLNSLDDKWTKLSVEETQYYDILHYQRRA